MSRKTTASDFYSRSAAYRNKEVLEQLLEQAYTEGFGRAEEAFIAGQRFMFQRCSEQALERGFTLYQMPIVKMEK